MRKKSRDKHSQVKPLQHRERLRDKWKLPSFYTPNHRKPEKLKPRLFAIVRSMWFTLLVLRHSPGL
jgi:hypothetical protein